MTVPKIFLGLFYATYNQVTKQELKEQYTRISIMHHDLWKQITNSNIINELSVNDKSCSHNFSVNMLLALSSLVKYDPINFATTVPTQTLYSKIKAK